MKPKYPKGLLWRMKGIELKAIADAEGISYPEDANKLELYRIVLANIPMIEDYAVVPPGAQPGPIPPIVEKPIDDSPASARIKRIRQANQ